jgi:hypothetical protein
MANSSAPLASPHSSGELKGPGPTLTAVVRDESDRNPIFDALITSDGEIAGLVAYSLYKQNKRDWLEAFKTQTGRLPTEAETRSYIIGESTERRLTTYRQLAQSTLRQPSGRAGAYLPNKTSPLAAAVWALAVVIALALIGFLFHSFGWPGK